VSETSAWQFARFPAAPEYCWPTPTEHRPCFGGVVSSTMSTASGPPTSSCAFAASTRSSGPPSHVEALTKWCSWP
jgi:hypothetical protein